MHSPRLRTFGPAAAGVVAVIGTLAIAPPPAYAQGDIYDSGNNQQTPNKQTLSIEISQSSADLHHGLAIEIEAERIDSGAETIWKRSSATVSKYEPQCYVDYNAAHNLIPTLNKEFLSKDYNGANATAKKASAFLSTADACSNKPLVAQANSSGGNASNPMNNPYYDPSTANSGTGGPPPAVTNAGGTNGRSSTGTPLKGGVANPWLVWNQGVASAINAEFQQRTKDFRSQYNGGARVPLSVQVRYTVVKHPWNYNGKNLNYHIVIDGTPGIDPVPYGNYGLTSQGIQNLQKAYMNIVVASIYAAQASYQARLTFPQPVAGNAVGKSGTFRNEPGQPELTYDDGPAGE